MISGSTIKAAAEWLAEQWTADTLSEWSRLERVMQMIRESVASTEGKPGVYAGLAVPCRAGGLATVHLRPEGVYGYLPDEQSPSFIWPPELAEKSNQKGNDGPI